MILKFSGQCVGIVPEKKGAVTLLLEDTSEEEPRVIGVRCWGDIGKSAAKARRGDTVDVRARLETRKWDPPNGGEPRWFTGVSALSITVDIRRPSEPTNGDDDVPF